uniref:Uncharacterized protein n=1 Tax=Lactuca sativa TaxID=4236 RepID=A0A9R1VIU4_LACSA|nr:hypothetical protein LSAT_V11C500260560 [Lactuca sativa]
MARLTFSLCFIGFFLCLIMCTNSVQLKARLPNRSCNKFLTIFVDNSTARRFNLEDHALALRNHASYAIDLNFQINGVCDISYATPAVTDPSFGTCVYP